MIRKIMSKKLSKGLSLLLVLCMMITLLPAEAMAAELGTDPAAAVLEDDADSAAISEDPAGEAVTAPKEEVTTDAEEPAAETPTEAEVPAEELPVNPEMPAEEATVNPEEPAAEDPTVEKPADAVTPAEEEPMEEVPAVEESIEEIVLGAPVQQDLENGIAPLANEISMVTITKNKRVPLDTDTFYKIFHLDCGRKYFSVAQIKAIIDIMAANDYNTLELAVGNDGLRFLLDDMEVTASGSTYSSEAVKSAIQAGNKKYYDAGTNELTEAEMDDIITYASGKGISIIPLINTPGHMDAILSAAEELTGTTCSYNGSARTIDVTNAQAVNFTLALVDKYIQYFADKECTIFNMGCDEYANDKYTSGSMGFGQLVSNGKYGNFVTYVNNMAAQVQNAGMTPMAFNDGFYFNGNTTSGTFDTDIAIAYWSSGWSSYRSAAASELASKGHKIINTNGDWYYVLGRTDSQDMTTNIQNAPYNSVMGSGTMDVNGCMICFWCDTPSEAYDENAAADLTSQITAFAELNANVFDVEGTDPDVTVPTEKTITVIAGQSTTDTIDGADYSENVDTTKLDKTIATVSVQRKDGQTEKTTQEVTEITSGKQYLIVNTRTGKLLTDDSYSSGLALSGTLSADSVELWTITPSNNGYTIKNASGKYLTIGNGSASLNTTSSALGLSFNGITWTISQSVWRSIYYLNDYGATGNLAAGWADGAASTDSGSQWKIYEIVDASGGSVTEVTFTAASDAAGKTTEVTVGNTHYTINVVSEDVSKVDPLTIEYWITNGRSTDSNGNTFLSIAAVNVYSEEGAVVANLVPENTTKENRTLQYWRCRLLDRTKSNSSTSSTEEQTETAGDDETYNGIGFTKVRYYNGAWSVYTENNEWVDISNNHQLVAYYLEILPVADELVVNAADWGKKGDGTTSGDYLDPQESCTVSIQVVYEDGTMNPATTTAADLKSSTIAYGYWTSGRGIGTLNLTGLEGYQIWKIEAETGAETYTSSSSIWGSYTVDGFTWDNNAMTVYEGDAVDSYVIHNDANNPSNNGYYANLMWDENHEAILIKVYVKAKPTDDTLKVIYYDEKFGDELYAYNINVKNNVNFDSIIPNPEIFDGNEERIDVTGCGIENSLGVTQYFRTNLTEVPEAVGKYNSKLYKYTGSVISEDKKTLYLYYNIDTEALSPIFVADFGLPITFSLNDVVGDNQLEMVKKVSVNQKTRYGTLAYSEENKTFTYTPTEVLPNIDVLTINILFDGNETSTISNVGVMPATTVYYEEGFAASSGFTGGSKGSGTQATQIAGESSDEYGYDAKYVDKQVGPSNNTQATSTAKGDKATFAFTGTGLDVYTNNTENTGYLMVQVKNSSGSTVKLIQVDTAMKNGTTDATAEQNVTAYNVPVVSLTDLSYGTYTAILTNLKGGTVNLDGFRVYGTLENQKNDAYTKDNEDDPVFIELRDRVLASLNAQSGDSAQYASQIARNIYSQVYATAGTTEGAVITDASGNYTADQLTDLLDNGPKNEIYLQNNQAVTFKLNTNREVQVGLKALNAETSASYVINNGESMPLKLSTSTDMFYTVLNGRKGESAQAVTITITNNGAGILAVTKVKVCDDPAVAFASLTEEDLIPALESLGIEKDPGTDEPDPVPTYADAVLTVAVNNADGNELASTTLTVNGVEGENAVFTADEIKAAVEALVLPEDYKLEDVSYSDVTVTCGESDSVSFKAVKEEVIEPTPTPDPEPEPTPTPDEPTSVIGKIFKTIKNFFDRIFRW